MSGLWIRVLLAVALLPAARADFQLLALQDSGAQTAPAFYNLGAVAPGDLATARFRVRNQANAAAVLSYLEVRGAGFGPTYPLALPLTLDAQASVDFNVTFSAPDTGSYSAALVSEGTSVILFATVTRDIPFPTPRLSLALPHALSAQQGAALVRFDGPAPRGGDGTLTLDFHPALAGSADAAIAFAAGGRTAAFTFARGDTQARFGTDSAALFQTGTTAGVLAITAALGNASDQATVAIAPALVGINAAQGTRSATSLEVHVTGFDNTRTAGLLSFTFFDATGTPIAPGAIRADVSATFRQFYQTSNVGGSFLLQAVFPVTGNAAQVAAFEVSISNSAGATTSARTQF